MTSRPRAQSPPARPPRASAAPAALKPGRGRWRPPGRPARPAQGVRPCWPRAPLPSSHSRQWLGVPGQQERWRGWVPCLVVPPRSGRAEVRLQPAPPANPSRNSQGSFVEGAPSAEVLAVPALLDPTLQTGHRWSQTTGRLARWRGGGWLLLQNICRARIQPVSPTAQAPVWLVWIWGWWGNPWSETGLVSGPKTAGGLCHSSEAGAGKNGRAGPGVPAHGQGPALGRSLLHAVRTVGWCIGWTECANRGPVQGRSSYPALAPESHLIAGLPRPRGSHSRCPAERDYRIVHPSVQEPCGEVLLCAAPLQRAGEPERPEKTPLPHLALPGLTSGLQEPLECVC